MKKELKVILQPIEEQLKKVDENIKKQLTTGITLLDESALHLFSRGGKKIRASLVLLSSGLLGGQPEGITELAASAEIVHAATLIHDDIIDQALLRRGDLTVSKKYGSKAAVLAGDYMYTVALSIAVDDGDGALFPTMVYGTRDMVKGELYQLQYSNIDSITEEHYYKIIELKTACFMETCTKLGARKGGLSAEQSEKVGKFGFNLGMAFQIIDDTLDVVQQDATTGKDSGNDFYDGKITLPFLYILGKAEEKERNELRSMAKIADEKSWTIIRKKIIDQGGIDYSFSIARKYIDDALALLSAFPDTENKKILMEMANFIIEREY